MQIGLYQISLYGRFRWWCFVAKSADLTGFRLECRVANLENRHYCCVVTRRDGKNGDDGVHRCQSRVANPSEIGSLNWIARIQRVLKTEHVYWSWTSEERKTPSDGDGEVWFRAFRNFSQGGFFPYTQNLRPLA